MENIFKLIAIATPLLSLPIGWGGLCIGRRYDWVWKVGLAIMITLAGVQFIAIVMYILIITGVIYAGI